MNDQLFNQQKAIVSKAAEDKRDWNNLIAKQDMDKAVNKFKVTESTATKELKEKYQDTLNDVQDRFSKERITVPDVKVPEIPAKTLTLIPKFDSAAFQGAEANSRIQQFLDTNNLNPKPLRERQPIEPNAKNGIFGQPDLLLPMTEFLKQIAENTDTKGKPKVGVANIGGGDFSGGDW